MLIKLLKAKHWQIFLILVGFPIVIQFIAITLMIIHGNDDFMLIMAPIVFVIYCGIFFGWFWAVGTKLHSKLPETVTLNLRRFKNFMLFPIVYLSSIFLLIGFGALGILKTEDSKVIEVVVIVIIVVTHLFSLFCLFYGLWFNAKTIKSVELQRSVKFIDFAGEFFLLWFFPIGIWFIQPKINKMISSQNCKSFSLEP